MSNNLHSRFISFHVLVTVHNDGIVIDAISTLLRISAVCLSNLIRYTTLGHEHVRVK